MTGVPRTVGITCMGCGLLCDDVTVSVTGNGVSNFLPPCTLGAAWLGSGAVPGRIQAGQRDATFEAAIAAAARVAVDARGRVLVYLAPGLTIEALKPAVSVADRIRAVVDTDTSSSAASGILAGQRRGRAAATLGELRNRGDIVLFWGVTPSRSHPRFTERLVEATGTHVPEGRASRTVIAVRIGEDGAVDGADITLEIPATGELAALSLLRANIAGATSLPGPGAPAGLPELATRLAAARYVAIVGGGDDPENSRQAQRAEGLIALTQSLNTPTRAALFTLRSGDNRNGVEALLTWQTGYPFAVDFRRGAPEYGAARRGCDDIGSFDAALVLGDWRTVPADSIGVLGGLATVVIGPGASEMPGAPRVAIDTGRAGIHEGGTAYRMDDVPLPLAPVLDGPRTAAMVLGALEDAVIRALREAAP